LGFFYFGGQFGGHFAGEWPVFRLKKGHLYLVS
jgi:hypothetical protein